MKKTPKKKTVKRTSGTPVLGIVHIEYVQINVPEAMIVSTAEALSQLILSDSYRKYLPESFGDA